MKRTQTLPGNSPHQTPHSRRWQPERKGRILMPKAVDALVQEIVAIVFVRVRKDVPENLPSLMGVDPCRGGH